MTARALAVVALLLLASAAPGCVHVLSKSQVEAVSDFANGTAGYEKLPARVIRDYQSLRANDTSLLMTAFPITSNDDALAVFKKMETELALGESMNATADQLDASLGVLATYTQLLQKLTSTDFDDQAEKSSRDLGEKLKPAGDIYARRYPEKKPLPRLAGIVAAAIDAAGSLYISIRQEHYLTTYVPQMDPWVQALTADIDALLARLVNDSAEQPGLLTLEKERLREAFTKGAPGGRAVIEKTDGARERASFFHPALSADESKLWTDALQRHRALRALTGYLLAATAAFRNAHAALVAGIREKRDLTGRIAEVITVVEEVKKARALKEALEQ